MFALDGTHSKNHLGGTILFLVGYDSNGHIRIVAFMFYDGETSENYKLFAERCKVAGWNHPWGRPRGFQPEPPVVLDSQGRRHERIFEGFPELTRLYCVWLGTGGGSVLS